jgi:hypothetical protein
MFNFNEIGPLVLKLLSGNGFQDGHHGGHIGCLTSPKIELDLHLLRIPLIHNKKRKNVNVAKSERLVFVANYRVMLLDVPLKLFEWSI